VKSWKRLIACIKKDFSLVKQDLLPFCLVYIVLSALYYAVSYGMSRDMTRKPILLIPFFAVLIGFSVLLLANQYWFQKAYSKKIGVPADHSGKQVPGQTEFRRRTDDDRRLPDSDPSSGYREPRQASRFRNESLVFHNQRPAGTDQYLVFRGHHRRYSLRAQILLFGGAEK
jgi:hypothetical protein